MRCPISNCKKVQEAEMLHAQLWQQNMELQDECLKLQQVPELFASTFRLFQEGYQVLGIEEKYGSFYAVVMEPHAPDSCSQKIFDDRTIHLYQLPYHSASASLGYIGIDLRECCSIYIDDIEVNSINQGHGSMLLKNLISYFQGAGFRTLLGKISSVDRDHFDRLRHFYEKFGFDVKIRGTSGSIRLDLQKIQNPVIESNGEIVCCRGSGYSKLRSEYMLAAMREQQDLQQGAAPEHS